MIRVNISMSISLFSDSHESAIKFLRKQLGDSFDVFTIDNYEIEKNPEKDYQWEVFKPVIDIEFDQYGQVKS